MVAIRESCATDTHQEMNNNYRKQDWMLPNGCKDVYEVLKLDSAKLAPANLNAVKHDGAEGATLPAGFKTTTTDVAFVITACLPGLHSKDVEITGEGSLIRIIIAKGNRSDSFEGVIHVPSGYCIGDGRANYFNSELRIIIPKSAA